MSVTFSLSTEGADRAGKGMLLRGEEHDSSLISAWRNQRDAGVLKAMGKPFGPAPIDPTQACGRLRQISLSENRKRGGSCRASSPRRYGRQGPPDTTDEVGSEVSRDATSRA